MHKIYGGEKWKLC
jgi:hypothetical protein